MDFRVDFLALGGVAAVGVVLMLFVLIAIPCKRCLRDSTSDFKRRFSSSRYSKKFAETFGLAGVAAPGFEGDITLVWPDSGVLVFMETSVPGATFIGLKTEGGLVGAGLSCFIKGGTRVRLKGDTWCVVLGMVSLTLEGLLGIGVSHLIWGGTGKLRNDMLVTKGRKG